MKAFGVPRDGGRDRAAEAAGRCRNRRARRPARRSRDPAHARRNAAARGFRRSRDVAVPVEHAVVVDRLEPERRSSATPASNSSRANGLAGATMAIRSPRRSARGLRIAYANLAISAATAWCSSRPSAARSAGAGQTGAGGRGARKPFLDAPVTRERVLDALERSEPVLDGMDDGLRAPRPAAPATRRT